VFLKWVAGNLSLRCKDLPVTAASDAIRGLTGLDWERVAAAAAGDMARGILSKFQPCLPEEAEARLLAERLLDRPGTLKFLASVKVNGARVAARPSGVRLADVEATGPMPIEFAVRAIPGAAATPRNEVQWIDTPAALRAASDELRTADVVGLDVETALDFGTLCLVQIATRSRTYLIDPFATADLKPLTDVLNGPRPIKVIHNARFERRVLAAVGLPIDGVFDTLEASRRARGMDALGGHSLAMVCERERELGIVLDKSAQTSNWSRRPLDVDQLRYAALDAEVLLLLYDRIGQGGQDDTHDTGTS
jgi:ATP-dependent Lhr-like helicase